MPRYPKDCGLAELGRSIVLHASIDLQYWHFSSSAAYRAASDLSDALADGRLRATAAESIAFDTLTLLADAYHDADVPGTILAVVADAVITRFDELAAMGAVRLADTRRVAESAFRFANRFKLRYPDAIAVALAGSSGAPLIIADDPLYDQLESVMAVAPAFERVRLREYRLT